jgi:transcriptional regulator with XRE-family HTH domain
MNSTNETKEPILSQNPKRFSNVADMVRHVSENKEQAEETARQIEEMNIVNFLVGLRTAQEMSQSDVAEKIGCTQSKVSKLENGIDNNLNIGDVNAYARALGFEMMIVLGKKDRTLVQQINVHMNAVRRLMTRLAEFVGGSDDLIKHGATGAFLSAAEHLITGTSEVLQNIVAACPNLPKDESHAIQIQADSDNNDALADPVEFDPTEALAAS